MSPRPSSAGGIGNPSITIRAGRRLGRGLDKLRRGWWSPRIARSPQHEPRGAIPAARIAAARASCSIQSTRSNTTHSIMRAGQPERQKSAESPAYQAVARISVLVRRRWAGLAVDELPGGNHRRERAGATPGGGAYGAYRCATNGGGWGPGHMGNVGAAHTSRLFASGRFSPRAPAPVAPPLPARRAIQRDRPDENAPSRLFAVRRLLPILPHDDRLTTEQTGGERIGDEAIANPGVDPLALVTDGGGLRFRHNRQSFHRR